MGLRTTFQDLYGQSNLIKTKKTYLMCHSQIDVVYLNNFYYSRVTLIGQDSWITYKENYRDGYNASRSEFVEIRVNMCDNLLSAEKHIELFQH